MKYTYYPGCSAESTSRDQHTSSKAVAEALGIDFIELKGWSCCGSTPAHQTDRVLAASLSAANLQLAQKAGRDVVVNCASCYSRLKTANHEVSSNPGMRQKVGEAMGGEYDGSVNVRHFIEVLIHDLGLGALQEKLKYSLNGLKVAPYYGCLLVRPREIMGFDDPENPTSMDRLITAMGGESIDWPHKVECCGGGLALTRTDLVISLTDSILSMAEAAGAECIAVACPMCQVNLDMRQLDIERNRGKQYNLPILYITQLLALCLGASREKTGLNKLMVPPEKVTRAVISGVSAAT